MFRQNIKLFFRSIFQQKTHFLLKVVGLVIGLAAVFMAFVSIQDEMRYDCFHQQNDRIFRVNKYVVEENGDLSKNAETPGKMAPALELDFPEVEKATHLAVWFDQVLLTYEDQHSFVKNWLFVDSNFFEVFDFEVDGNIDPADLLSKPGQVLITPRLSKNLFGAADPVGKLIKGVGDKDFTVAGLVKPAPRQSHIQYDLLASWASTESRSGFLDYSFMNNWLGQTVATYVLLNQPQQLADVNKKLPAFTTRYMDNRKDVYTFYLQPLREIYLHSTDLLYLRGGKYGSALFLRTFSLVALMILLIACFNYINITTARSLHRAREVGIKKVLGVKKSQLIGQFLTETFGLTLIAGGIAFALAHLLLPQLNLWFDKDIPPATLNTVMSTGFLLSVVGLTSLLAGFFPSVLLTGFRPVAVLKNTFKLAPGGEWPRQVLTILQLAVSIGLIAGTMLLYRQFEYIQNKDLGFDKEQLLVMKTPPDIRNQPAPFRNELLRLPGVKEVSICQAAVGDGTFGSTVIPEGSEQELMVQMFRVDSSYVETFGMEMVEGRSLGMATDFNAGAVVVNEVFVEQAGWQDGENKTIRLAGSEQKFPVVGVLRDFNFNSLRQEVSPLVMYLDSRKTHMSVRVDPAQLSGLIPSIKKLWERFESRYPFDYYFLDEYFARQYLAEQRMLKVISLFAFLAILIACLGLYGMASLAIARRTKEIGIRKVLGASVFGIVRLLSVRFLKLVLLAFLISVPVVYYYSNDWLNNFAFHVDPGWMVFLAAGFTVGIIVVVTVGFQSMKAALSHPVESLRSE